MASEYLGERSLRKIFSLFNIGLKKKVDNDDPRLTDSRTPNTHANTHSTNGSDPITPSDIGAVATSDIVDSLDSSDANKVLSAAQGKALAEALKNINVTSDVGEYIAQVTGAPKGLCPLDETGLVSSDYLPSYVDDVIEGYYMESMATGVLEQAFYIDSEHTQLIVPEKGIIYIDLDGSGCYRWTGSRYVEIPSNFVEMEDDEIQSIWDSVMGNVEPPMIAFVITLTNGDNTKQSTYNAREGMTWEEWINSENNVDGFFVTEEGFVCVDIDGVTYYLQANIDDTVDSTDGQVK